MQEIRFNRGEGRAVEEEPKVEIIPKRHKRSSVLKIFLWLALVAIVVATLLFLPAFTSQIRNKFLGKKSFVTGDNSPYAAVFLDNGQVYFGEISSLDKAEMALLNVFYLQVSDNAAAAQAELNQAKFNLIKLGSELHGPADILYVNRSHIVFYEELRKDSKIVESISNFQVSP